MQFSNDQTLPWLFDRIYEDPTNSRRRASALILRPCVVEHFSPADLSAAITGNPRKQGKFLDALESASKEAPQAFARFDDIPIYVLHSDNFIHRLSENINPCTQPPASVADHLTDPATLAAIRSAELEHIITRSRALLMPVEGAYYYPPSGKPIRSFLRIGNIQYSRQAIDAVAFWLLPYMTLARAILIDTWSISSIALNLSRVLTIYDDRKPMPVEMLTRYQDRSPEAHADLLEVLDRLWGECNSTTTDELIPVTCIISATQTGSLADVLKYEIESAGLPIEMIFITLFQLGKTETLPSLCDRSNAPEFAPIPPDSVEQRSAIYIDPQVYFPLAYRDIEFTLRKKQAKGFSNFADTFGTAGVISAHRDEISDGSSRHHAVHLDMKELTSTLAFRSAFDAEVVALVPPPKAILTPRHEVAVALGERAVKVLAEAGHSAVHIEHSSLLLRDDGPSAQADTHIREVLSGLSSSDSLLILDDCFITGDRLTGYQTRLRQLNVRARLHYRVGVSRPEDMAHWEQCRAMLSYRDDVDKQVYTCNTIETITSLVLPNWQEADCPWCAELRLYRRLQAADHTLSSHILKRANRLSDRNSGLVNDLFLVSPSQKPLELFSGSIFAPPASSQATIFAAISSALQQLRTVTDGKRPTLGPRRYPIATILRAREYLKNTYTDSVLRASILRAGCADELGYMSEAAEHRRTNLITSIITSARWDERNLTHELIIANAARKCMIDPDLDASKLEATAAALLIGVRLLQL